jgi:pimeloyl-ACP methyl ester carboxylesterase
VCRRFESSRGHHIHSYLGVIPRLAAVGLRVVVPYLRGHGPTRFLDPATPRSGQQAAIGADVIALMDALAIPTAIVAGYDWGGRAACVVAALARALHRHRLGQQLPDSGHRELGDPSATKRDYSERVRSSPVRISWASA